MGLADGRKRRSDIDKVYDEVGVMRQGKKLSSRGVDRRRHFERVLNEGGRSEVEGSDGGEEVGSGFELNFE